MTSSLAELVLLAPLAFLVAALVALRHPGRDVGRSVAVGAAVSWFGVVVAAGAGLAVALRGAVQSPTLGVEGLGLSVRLDALSTIMLVMVALLAVVIVRYSGRYLEGDERHGRFLARLFTTIAAVEVLILSGNTVLLFAAWVATSLALHRLLVFYRDRRGAVVAARKKFVAARLGDALLLGAVVLLWVEFGTGDLGTIFAEAPGVFAAGGSTMLTAAAICLAGAALLKSAQFPTHGWLVEVMETPTPVSALLHAGILNAGPFLMMRFAFVMDDAAVANAMLIVVGGATAVFASVVLLTQPSVKVVLGYSSAAHMGFMLMVCGMGAYAAALLHLVAHSFYKAHAFLSSGSVIDEARAAKVPLPQRLGRPSRVLASVVVALAMYLPLAWSWGMDLGGDPVVLAIGAILVMGTTQLLAPALDSAGTARAMVRTGLAALSVTTAFFALEVGFHHLLYTTAPHGTGRPAALLGLMAVVLVVFAAVVGMQIVEPARGTGERRRRWAVHLRHGFYANAAFDRLVGAWRLPRPERVAR
jgi:NAD(P)H-quinone oxidoreductase subunit 5